MCAKETSVLHILKFWNRLNINNKSISITPYNKFFTFSSYWKESVIFQLFMPKVNGKDQFFSLNFAFVTFVMKMLKHYGRLYLGVCMWIWFYMTVSNHMNKYCKYFSSFSYDFSIKASKFWFIHSLYIP